MDAAGLDAYTRFSPDGIVAQRIARQGRHRDMPFLRMAADLRGTPAEAARAVALLNNGSGPRFTVCRSILQTPTWYAQVEKELKATDERIQVVDLYTLLWLVREYESHREAYADALYAQAKAVTATPRRGDGLAPTFAGDGPVVEAIHEGTRSWRIAASRGGRYLYFDVDDSFYRPGSGPVVVEAEYFDQGTGRLTLQYDATDDTYKTHATVAQRKNSGRWQSATFNLSDARFASSQNGGADFRFHSSGDDLLICRVRVTQQ
jgi:hypothetical protein